MMNNIETMKRALEALLEDRAWLESDAPKEAWDKNNQAITALRQAIEQAQQAEPVLWAGVDFDIKTSPPFRQPLTWERVLEIGLECANDHSRLPYEVKVARAIEAAHGIKENT